jgi:hypothetical protein
MIKILVIWIDNTVSEINYNGTLEQARTFFMTKKYFYYGHTKAASVRQLEK